MDDFEVVGGEAIEVGNPVINFSFPLGNALAFGIKALLGKGRDGSFVGVGNWRNRDLLYIGGLKRKSTTCHLLNCVIQEKPRYFTVQQS